MATLIRPRSPPTLLLDVADTSQHPQNADLTLTIPKPFPTRAEREQEALLDSLASEELILDERGFSAQILDENVAGKSAEDARMHDEQTASIEGSERSVSPVPAIVFLYIDYLSYHLPSRRMMLMNRRRIFFRPSSTFRHHV